MTEYKPIIDGFKKRFEKSCDDSCEEARKYFQAKYEPELDGRFGAVYDKGFRDGAAVAIVHLFSENKNSERIALIEALMGEHASN